MLKISAAILIVLAVFAFAASTLATLNLPMPKLCDVSLSAAYDGASPVQPLGDPVDGDGDFPH